MLGSYDFCGHYEWTFTWLNNRGGPELLSGFWEEAISRDSQLHARELIAQEGIEGMKAYWGYTLAEESPELGFRITVRDGVFRIDMHDCPSKGFLTRNGLEQYPDYCDHCIGWIGPMMRDTGFVIDHEHNHRGQCWWEMRSTDDERSPGAIASLSGGSDVRSRADWDDLETPIDRFCRAHSAAQKESS
tara:strand:- start:79 stop:642 length:564 start_codon:yes stop_codon:yes gene_type:complete